MPLRPPPPFLVREMPLVGALLALGSLALMPLLAPAHLRGVPTDGETLDRLSHRVDAGEAEAALAGLRAFRRERPAGGPHAAEAHFQLSRALLASARGAAVSRTDRLDEAWSEASFARLRGFRPARVRALQREIAAFLHEHGFARESAARLGELMRDADEPGLALLRADDLATLAFREPDRRDAHLAEALELLDRYFKAVPAAERLAQVLAQVHVLWRAGRHEEMLPLLLRALEESPQPLQLGRLQLERGKALSRLGRSAEAHAALDEAEELMAREDALRDQARFFRAELYARAGNPEGEAIWRKLVQDRSALASLADLSLGIAGLGAGDPAAIDRLEAGLKGLQAPDLLVETGFNLPAFLAALRRSWETENEAPRVLRCASLLRELRRLFPAYAEVAWDLAGALRRAPEPGEAADQYLDAARLGGGRAETGVREAAATCREGRLTVRAAALYRKVHEVRPSENLEDLFLQGECLREAGLRPDALAVYGLYAASAGAADLHTARAVLERGRILAELGKPSEALAELDRVLRAEEIASDPRKAEWAEALLERGRILLEGRRLKEARASLLECAERYAEEPARRPLAARAVYHLARAAAEDREWPEALARLSEFERLAAGEPSLGALHREARFLRGEAHHAREEYEEAARVFGNAYHEFASAEDRLRGLVGCARAHARLGRLDEARRDLEIGRRLHEGARAELDRSLAGHGKTYWTSTLESLRGELQ